MEQRFTSMLPSSVNGGGRLKIFNRLALILLLSFVGQISAWGTVTGTLVHTASTWCGSDNAVVTYTLDAQQERYHNEGSQGNQGYAFAEFSISIPKGHTITSATLAWKATVENQNASRNTTIYYLNPGQTVNFDAIDAGTAGLLRYNNAKTSVESVSFQTTSDITTTVTDAVNACLSQGYVIFQWTNNPGGAKLEGKASADAPVLTITTECSHTIDEDGTINAENTAWWNVFSPFYEMKKGMTYTFSFHQQNDAGNTSNKPWVIYAVNSAHHNGDTGVSVTEYSQVGALGYDGWGAAVGTVTYPSGKSESDFKTELAAGMDVTVTVTWGNDNSYTVNATSVGTNTYTYSCSGTVNATSPIYLFFATEKTTLSNFTETTVTRNSYDFTGSGSDVSSLGTSSTSVNGTNVSVLDFTGVTYGSATFNHPDDRVGIVDNIAADGAWRLRNYGLYNGYSSNKDFYILNLCNGDVVTVNLGIHTTNAGTTTIASSNTNVSSGTPIYDASTANGATGTFSATYTMKQDGAIKLSVGKYNHVASITIEHETATPSITISPKSFTYELLDLNFTEPVPVTVPAGAGVTYTSSDPDVASVNPTTGEVMFKKPTVKDNPVRITATMTVDGQSYSDYYDITVMADYATYEVHDRTYTLTGSGVLQYRTVTEVPFITMEYGGASNNNEITIVRNYPLDQTDAATLGALTLDADGWQQMNYTQDGTDFKPTYGTFYKFTPALGGNLTIRGRRKDNYSGANTVVLVSPDVTTGSTTTTVNHLPGLTSYDIVKEYSFNGYDVQEEVVTLEAGKTYYLYANTGNSNSSNSGWNAFYLHGFTYDCDFKFDHRSVVMIDNDDNLNNENTYFTNGTLNGNYYVSPNLSSAYHHVPKAADFTQGVSGASAGSQVVYSYVCKGDVGSVNPSSNIPTPQLSGSPKGAVNGNGSTISVGSFDTTTGAITGISGYGAIVVTATMTYNSKTYQTHYVLTVPKNLDATDPISWNFDVTAADHRNFSETDTRQVSYVVSQDSHNMESIADMTENQSETYKDNAPLSEWKIVYKVRQYNKDNNRYLEYISNPVLSVSQYVEGDNARAISSTAGLLFTANANEFGSMIWNYLDLLTEANFTKYLTDNNLEDNNANRQIARSALLNTMLNYQPTDTVAQQGQSMAYVPEQKTAYVTFYNGSSITIPNLKAGWHVRMCWNRYEDYLGDWMIAYNVTDLEGRSMTGRGFHTGAGSHFTRVGFEEFIVERDGDVTFQLKDSDISNWRRQGWTNIRSIEIAKEFLDTRYSLKGINADNSERSAVKSFFRNLKRNPNDNLTETYNPNVAPCNVQSCLTTRFYVKPGSRTGTLTESNCYVNPETGVLTVTPGAHGRFILVQKGYDEAGYSKGLGDSPGYGFLLDEEETVIKVFEHDYNQVNYPHTWAFDHITTDTGNTTDADLTVDAAQGGYHYWSNGTGGKTFNVGYPENLIAWQKKKAVTYKVPVGKTFTAGETVTVNGCYSWDASTAVATLTVGASGDSNNFIAAAAASGVSAVEGFTAYTEGNNKNGVVNNDGTASSGTVYTIRPTQSGVINVGVIVNYDRPFYILEDGQVINATRMETLEAPNATTTATTIGYVREIEKFYGMYTFPVTANKLYTIYCPGSKVGFYGFTYAYGTNSSDAATAPGITYVPEFDGLGFKPVNYSDETDKNVLLLDNKGGMKLNATSNDNVYELIVPNIPNTNPVGTTRISHPNKSEYTVYLAVTGDTDNSSVAVGAQDNYWTKENYTGQIWTDTYNRASSGADYGYEAGSYDVNVNVYKISGTNADENGEVHIFLKNCTVKKVAVSVESKRVYAPGYATEAREYPLDFTLAKTFLGKEQKAYKVSNVTPTEVVDKTSSIENPSFGTYSNNNTAGTSTASDWTGTITDCAYGAVERFNNDINFYQTISGLKPGRYEVTVQGFYRYGGYVDAATARSGGTETLQAYLYAYDGTTNDGTATKQKALPSIFGEANKIGAVGVNTTLGYVPDNMEQAAAYFAAGLYPCSLTVTVGNGGTLTIGVKKTATQSNDWVIFDNFHLYCLDTDEDADPNNHYENTGSVVTSEVRYIPAVKDTNNDGKDDANYHGVMITGQQFKSGDTYTNDYTDWPLFTTDIDRVPSNMTGNKLYGVVDHTKIQADQLTDDILPQLDGNGYYNYLLGVKGWKVDDHDETTVIGETYRLGFYLLLKKGTLLNGVAYAGELPRDNSAHLHLAERYCMHQNLPSSSEAKARRAFFIDDEGFWTAIEELPMDDAARGFADDENGRVEQGVYYSLQGIPVAHPTKGIYILNGKKVFVK